MRKIKSLALSSNELDRGGKFAPPSPKIGSTNTPPEIGLKVFFESFFYGKNGAEKTFYLRHRPIQYYRLI